MHTRAFGIMSQKRPRSARECAKAHSFLGGGFMAKRFLTYEQQIDKLVNEKGLLITNRNYAEDILKQTSYYSLISGYKDLFKNPTTKAYRKVFIDKRRFSGI